MTYSVSSGTLNLTLLVNLDWICWQRFVFTGIVYTWNWFFFGWILSISSLHSIYLRDCHSVLSMQCRAMRSAVCNIL